MPSLLSFGPYVLFFWLGEKGEPVHVHVAERRPVKHATKFWLTADGGCILASNGSKLSNKDLRRLAQFITYNHAYICERWKEAFGADSLHFYR